MKITDIHLNPANPMIIKDDKFSRLVESIRTFPKMMKLRQIIANREGMILGGNMRYSALLFLKYTEIPDEWVKIADELSPEEERIFVIEDNVSMGEWDWVEVLKDYTVDELTAWGLDIPDLEPEIEKVSFSATKKFSIKIYFKDDDQKESAKIDIEKLLAKKYIDAKIV